jgi:hypothetical protein
MDPTPLVFEPLQLLRLLVRHHVHLVVTDGLLVLTIVLVFLLVLVL